MTVEDIDRDEQVYDAAIRQAIDPLPGPTRTRRRLRTRFVLVTLSLVTRSV